jgi:hypothetical protein
MASLEPVVADPIAFSPFCAPQRSAMMETPEDSSIRLVEILKGE